MEIELVIIIVENDLTKVKSYYILYLYVFQIFANFT